MMAEIPERRLTAALAALRGIGPEPPVDFAARVIEALDPVRLRDRAIGEIRRHPVLVAVASAAGIAAGAGAVALVRRRRAIAASA